MVNKSEGMEQQEQWEKEEDGNDKASAEKIRTLNRTLHGTLDQVNEEDNMEAQELLLNQYRHALIQERTKRLLLQDLVYRQMKRMNQLMDKAQMNHEALLEMGKRNIQLEEELERIRNSSNEMLLATSQPKSVVSSQHGNKKSIMQMFGLNKSANITNTGSNAVVNNTIGSNSGSGTSSGSGNGSGNKPTNNTSVHILPLTTDFQVTDITSESAPSSPSHQKAPDSARSLRHSLSEENLENHVNEDSDKPSLLEASGLASIISPFKEKFNTNDGLNKIIKQQKYSISNLEKQVSEMKKREDDLVRQLKDQEEQMKNVVLKLVNTHDLLANSKKQLINFESEYSKLNSERAQLVNEVKKLQSQLEVNSAEIQTLKESEQKANLELKQVKEEQIPALQLTISNMQAELEEKNNTISQMGEKLIALKDQLNIVRLQLRKFTVNMYHGKLRMKTDATIVLHKNPMNNLFMIDIFEGKKNQKLIHSLPIRMIQHVELERNSNRFCISFANQVVEWFDAPNSSDIVNDIKEFMSIVASNE
jgi:hypothetical protein